MRQGQLVGGVAVVVDKVLNVAQGLHVEIFDDGQERHQGVGKYLGLGGGGDALVELVQRVHLKEMAEGAGVERHLVQFATGHQRLHLAAIVGHGGAQTAELVVNELEHTCQSAELTSVLGKYLHAALIADVVLDGRPHVLQGGAHLDLEAQFVE